MAVPHVLFVVGFFYPFSTSSASTSFLCFLALVFHSLSILSFFSKTLSSWSYSPKKNKKARAKRHCSVQKLEGRRGVPAAIKCTICHGSVHLLLHMLWNRKVYKCNKNTPSILCRRFLRGHQADSPARSTLHRPSTGGYPAVTMPLGCDKQSRFRTTKNKCSTSRKTPKLAERNNICDTVGGELLFELALSKGPPHTSAFPLISLIRDNFTAISVY